MSFCKVCGKELAGNQSNYCSRYCSKLGYKRRKKGLPENIRPKRSHLEWTDQDIQNRINTKSSKIIYIGGYKDCESSIYLLCSDCGNTFKWSACGLRKQSSIQCYNCRNLLTDIKEKEYREQLEQNKIIRHEEVLKRRAEEKHRYCKQCGKEFYSNRNQYYFCSEDCRIRLHNKEHDIKRRIKIKSALVDNDISLAKIIKRDKHRCWICGGKVDSSDYEVREDGSFVAGPRYPSIDHVKALSNGGYHSWNNVRLAHRKCNWEKSNKLFDWDEDNQLRLFI